MVIFARSTSCDICLQEKTNLKRFGLLFICAECRATMQAYPAED